MLRPTEPQTKAVVSVADMARMCGLSRQRFYQLMGMAFPYPLYDVASKRPFYSEELQLVCLEVKRRNCGIDGRPIMFYTSRMRPKSTQTVRSSAASKSQERELVTALGSLGLQVSNDQVASAVNKLLPSGTTGLDDGEVIRTLFVELSRQNSVKKLGR